MSVELVWKQKPHGAHLRWFGQDFESSRESGLAGAPPIKVIFGVGVRGAKGDAGGELDPETVATLNEWRDLPDLTLIFENGLI
ncbi:MAG: hypothetical protein FD163_2530 [Hyphomonadaceae bacterium]|nr:MAG: hypothetical protein FD163_2530 [Hyphomonadaceae bacterium]